MAERELEYELHSLVSDFDHEDLEELKRRGHAARVAIVDMPLPKELRDAVIAATSNFATDSGMNQNSR